MGNLTKYVDYNRKLEAPNGLKHDQILEEAQIIAVCDSYDAMTTNRSYKRSISKDEALLELMSLASVKYSKRIVELLTMVVSGANT